MVTKQYCCIEDLNMIPGISISWGNQVETIHTIRIMSLFCEVQYSVFRIVVRNDEFLREPLQFNLPCPRFAITITLEQSYKTPPGALCLCKRTTAPRGVYYNVLPGGHSGNPSRAFSPTSG